MLKAFTEILTGNPIGIIRVGPNAQAFHDPFNYAVVFDTHGGIAKIKALVARPPRCESCEWQKRFSMTAAGPIVDEIRKLGLTEDWDR